MCFLSTTPQSHRPIYGIRFFASVSPLLCCTPLLAFKPLVARTVSHRARCYTGVSCLLSGLCGVGGLKGDFSVTCSLGGWSGLERCSARDCLLVSLILCPLWRRTKTALDILLFCAKGGQRNVTPWKVCPSLHARLCDHPANHKPPQTPCFKNHSSRLATVTPSKPWTCGEEKEEGEAGAGYTNKQTA